MRENKLADLSLDLAIRVVKMTDDIKILQKIKTNLYSVRYNSPYSNSLNKYSKNK